MRGGSDWAVHLSLNLTIERLPFQFRSRKIQITGMEIFLKWKDISDPAFAHDGTPLSAYKAKGSPLRLTLTSPVAASSPVSFAPTS